MTPGCSGTESYCRNCGSQFRTRQCLMESNVTWLLSEWRNNDALMTRWSRCGFHSPLQMLLSVSSYPVPQLTSRWQRNEPSVLMQRSPPRQLLAPSKHSFMSTRAKRHQQIYLFSSHLVSSPLISLHLTWLYASLFFLFFCHYYYSSLL